MKFSVETWAPDYDGGGDASALEQATAEVEVNAEIDPGAWEPITPEVARDPELAVCFVDGVRRIDARVWIEHEGRTRPGACATVAAGVVRCADGTASLVAHQVSRGVYCRADGAAPIVTGHATYDLFPVTDDGPEGIYLGIHDRMTTLEQIISASCDADLVVFDGPLRGRSQVGGVGFVKTQHVRYLPDELEPIIGKLDAGQRTPVFLIGGRGSSRWSWYLRLPGPVAHAYSGVVRLELPGIGSVDDAVSRADQVSAMLPAYASQAHKDPRAPQNLYPIAGLERELRRRLGDPLLLERALRRQAAEG
ncbi:DNA double-strand break repair nuclease NurA [Aquihabitans daechungensis]|uniref:DNA double-strand break repair nuclease NurA n=1 Tax=Aquihabitans daechungensis TaxID=1052257 RepID=UPI003B9FA4C5